MSKEEPAPSRLDRYLSRDALVYYLLVLPALVSGTAFSLAIATSPGDLVTQAGAYGALASAAAQALPLPVLLLSIYAVFTFRPSVLVTLLVFTFFVAVSVANGVAVAGVQLNLEGTVFLVVTATFLALAGFNYSRGLVLAADRRPDTSSSGPAGYNVLGVALESAVPLLAALALVLVVESVVSTLAAQAVRLPAPLSTMAALYIQTRVGLVFITLFVAGAAVWVLREFLEPIILHFTLSAADAKRELLGEIEPTTKSVGKIARYRPSRGLSWGVLTIAYCAGIFAALALFLPRTEFSRDLVAVFTLRTPPAAPPEVLLQTAFQNAVVKINILFAQSQDFIRALIRLLWG
jgi:hypothetical protein